jgi:hypothetical protein
MTAYVDHGLGEGFGGFLRQIMPDAAHDRPVFVLGREFLGIGTLGRDAVAQLASPSRVIVGLHGGRAQAMEGSTSESFAFKPANESRLGKRSVFKVAKNLWRGFDL